MLWVSKLDTESWAFHRFSAEYTSFDWFCCRVCIVRLIYTSRGRNKFQWPSFVLFKNDSLQHALPLRAENQTYTILCPRCLEPGARTIWCCINWGSNIHHATSTRSPARISANNRNFWRMVGRFRHLIQKKSISYQIGDERIPKQEHILDALAMYAMNKITPEHRSILRTAMCRANANGNDWIINISAWFANSRTTILN